MADLYFHWSPVDRRKRIRKVGMMPGMKSVDGLWNPPYVCFSDSPDLAWRLSGAIHREIPVWDLWMFDLEWTSIKGFEKISDHYPDTGRAYVKEVRVYERIWKRDLWLVGSRNGEHGR